MGCPIRKSADQRPFAPPRGLSQLITSFIACESLGIRHTPFFTFARTEPASKQAPLIILSAFSIPHLIIIVNYQLSITISVEIRFTFCFRYQYVKERSGIAALSGNPRAWTSVPGRFPSFLLYILFTETRELQHPKQALFMRTSQYGNKAPERRCSWKTLKPLSAKSSERRCSSRTFRYGYLVTT